MVDKVLRRLNGQTVQYTPVVASAGATDGGKLIALGPDGKIDTSMYNPGTGVSTRPIVSSEAIGAGKFVNEYLNAGVLNIRLADNSNNRPAHGFVIAAVASAGTGAVYDLDAVNSALTGLTIGSDYYLGTAGAAVATPVDATAAATGTIDQKLGKALSATELKTQDFDYVVI